MSKRILIIEDEEVLLKILRDKFEKEGWSVGVAINGKEALEEIKKDNYDILLVDLLMPQVDGFEVIKTVRQNPAWKAIPIIVMSNLGDEDSINKAISLGADKYFIKNQHPISNILKQAEEMAK